jgi:hypothetical protein
LLYDSMLLDGGAQLDVIANQNGFLAAFDERDKGCRLCLLGGLVNNDGIEGFCSEKSNTGTNAGREDYTTLLDPIFRFFMGEIAIVNLPTSHGITSVPLKILSYFSNLEAN